ncbi:hypothetical protein [Streptomyces antarcticus]|uniref:hypothetical protein n=1 Tax=Streptomyces antarcticus TaxID=2996458 RepID=UPI00226F2D50|nr:MULTISPECIES: hypothetical protein [unclassified Streptomyces]MCY0941908.1 hypothetical protein [Streptomyces sp. H34-AA3]MCZ4082819.1 hypothetical protein [Streptomyces sp. H34-S5]
MTEPDGVRTRLTLNAGWQREALALPGVRELVAKHTGELLHRAITDAPRRGHRALPWNAIKKNLSAYVELSYDGWFGNVVIEDDPKVRHAMLQETGFTSPRGRKIRGRRYLKGALLQMRVK